MFWPLKELLHSIKSFSTHAINKMEGTSDGVWEKERFDRYVRSDRDLEEKFNYILRNPWEAGVVKQGEVMPGFGARMMHRKGKCVSARRRNQHARRVRYPEGRQCGDGPRYRPPDHRRHACALYENVTFSNLGLAVIDEQHKFGVAQRAKLTAREPAPDVLVMTATPIPRTLTMTIYGDLEVSTIDEMPRGRGEIITHLLTAINWAKRLHSCGGTDRRTPGLHHLSADR